MSSYVRYGKVAKLLHWLIASQVLLNIILGLILRNFPNSNLKPLLLSCHVNNGLWLLLFVILRIVWRLTHAYPDLTGLMPIQEKILARFGQYSMYGLMLAVPVSGILFAQSKGVNLSILGVELPVFLKKQPADIIKMYLEVHTYLVIIFATLILGHVIAALKHHFIDKNRVLLRMLPRFKK